MISKTHSSQPGCGSLLSQLPAVQWKCLLQDGRPEDTCSETRTSSHSATSLMCFGTQVAQLATVGCMVSTLFLLVAHSLGGYKLARPGGAERYKGTPRGNNLGTSTLLPARPRPLPATQNKMAGWTPRFTLARAYGNPSDPSTLSVPHPPSWPGSQSFLSFLWLCLLFYNSTLAISVISPPLRS